MRSLREKLYHAVAKGCEPRFIGIYTDYNMMSQAVSGRATSKHLSSRTIEEAVQFMSEHDVDDIRVIFVNKEGQKESYSVSKYKSDILGMASPVSRDKGAEVDEHVLNDLLTETISFPPDDDEIDSFLEDTIKECKKSVLSWMSAPSDVITQSPRPESSLSVANQLGVTRNQSRGSDVLVTSTPFRENVTANVSNISRIEDSHVVSHPEFAEEEGRSEGFEDTQATPKHIDNESQTEITGKEVEKLKSDLAKWKRQLKALLEEKDGLMKKNVGLRKANDILVKKNSKVESLKKELQKVEKQKNHLANERQRLERLLQEADCLFAANIMKDDSGFMQEDVSSEKTTSESSSVQQLEGCPKSDTQMSGKVYFPPNLLPADLDAWLSPRMHTSEDSDSSIAPSITDQAIEAVNLPDREMNVWVSS